MTAPKLAGQLDLLAALDAAPPPAPRREGSGAPDGVRSLTDADVRESLAEGLRFAVPIHMLELRTVPADRRRFYLPPGGLESLGMADSIMWRPKSWKLAARSFDAYARTLAILAYEPGGVDLFDVHFCAAPHPGCPHDWTPRPPVDGAATMDEFNAILDEYEALLDAEDGDTVPEPRPARTVPRTRRPTRAPRIVTVPTGGVL